MRTEGSSRRSAERARRTLSRLLSGDSLLHAISVAATLGIADLLERGPKSAGSLARATGSHQESLYRLLRALSAAGVFQEKRGRCFALTPMSNLLRTRAETSMRPVAALAGERWRRAAFGLAYSVRTGKSAFEKELGESFYDYLSANPGVRRLFDEVMTYHWRTMSRPILLSYDFSRARVIVDVGGGSGAMIESVLRRHAEATAVILETPAVAAETRCRLRSVGLGSRCVVADGTFFGRLPRGGDLYILAFVLHNWGDRQAVAILRGCRRALAAAGKVLVIETLLPGGARPSFAAVHDLEMLLYMPGGRERTLAEYRHLLKSAGLSLRRIVETGTTASLMEAVVEKGLGPRGTATTRPGSWRRVS